MRRIYGAQKGEGGEMETEIKPEEQLDGLVLLLPHPLPSRFLLNFQINDREISPVHVPRFPFAYCTNVLRTFVLREVTISYIRGVARTNFNFAETRVDYCVKIIYS